jgi:hypothetical protein
LKYKGKVDGVIYDGLDPEDNPEDYEKIYIWVINPHKVWQTMHVQD